MRKLSEIKGEAALDVLADILEPASEIMTDKEVVSLARSGKRIKAVSMTIKRHKRAVTEILAIMDGENPETYEPRLATLPIKLLELFNDPDIIQVFSLQSPNVDGITSGSAMENTKATETI